MDVYKDILERRGVKKIKQYKTVALRQVDRGQIPFFNYQWGIGDSYAKLSYQYYGDPKYWYIIARFNNKPTEADIVVGEMIYIPSSLSIALQMVV